MLIRLLLLFTACIYTQYHPYEWGSITSLLSPTGIQIAADGTVYASTSGGLLEFNPGTEKFNFIKTEHGLIYLDLSTIEMDSRGRLWLGGAYPWGYLQIYDTERGEVIKTILIDDKVSQLTMIRIGTNTAFAVYEGTTSNDIGILEFALDADGMPDYKDFYTNFRDEIITEIRDLDIFQDSLLYVTTDKGIFVGNTRSNLKSSEIWNVVNDDDGAQQFIPGEALIALLDSSIVYQQDDIWMPYCISGFTGQAVQAKQENDILYILTKEHYYKITGCVKDSLHIPVGNQANTSNALGYEFGTVFTSFDIDNNNDVYIGIQYNGILRFNDLENYDLLTPNTSLANEFQAITITKSGAIAATSHLGTLYFNEIGSQNYIPENYYQYYTGNSETFHALSLDYHPGQHKPISIIEKNNGHLIFCNSGVSRGWGGAIIELDLTSGNITKYDSRNSVIDGFWWIYPPHVDSEYMVVNQIEKDKSGNIWVVNPFCERYGHLLAIQSVGDDSWSHVSIPDSSSFRPQTIAFDNSRRAWIGFAYEALENRIYSDGGVKVFDPSDSSWISISNPEKLPGDEQQASVWSLVFDDMNFLWVMNEKGVRVYVEMQYDIETHSITLFPTTYSDNNTPYEFLSHISYVKGNRIRVDNQNNKWVITHQGVWVIQESMVFWPSKEGLHPYNSGLLSDKVYDVAFDDDKGLAYLATEKGISILQVPFAENPGSAESMYISPNPFIIPDDEFVLIKNIPSGSIIKIMTITGTLIKEIQLPFNQSQITWDGTNEQGQQVGTAVYLMAAHHPSERNKVSKIAVIRK